MFKRKPTNGSAGDTIHLDANADTSTLPPIVPVKLPESSSRRERSATRRRRNVGLRTPSRLTGHHVSGILSVDALWSSDIIRHCAPHTIFSGDVSITENLQKHKQPWLRRFFFGLSEIGFAQYAVPQTIGIAGIFWALRFRLEALFILLTSSATLLNAIVKRVIKRPRPTTELVTVVKVINEPSFPSGHVMYYTNFYGLLIYLLATNWRSGRIRNFLIGICAVLIACIGPSRIYLGAHWPSDVAAGYIYGGLWFSGIMAFYLRVKAWLHPVKGQAPAASKPLQQPGDEELVEA